MHTTLVPVPADGKDSLTKEFPWRWCFGSELEELCKSVAVENVPRFGAGGQALHKTHSDR